MGVFLLAKTNTSGKHDHFVKSIFFSVFEMLEGEYASTNERLPKFVSEVGSAIRGFCQYFLWRLIKPFALGEFLFPVAFTFEAGI